MEGYLEFSDRSPRVEVKFSKFDISRAAVSFESRKVTWVKFTGAAMQGTGGAHAGLAEFQVMSADENYPRHDRHKLYCDRI